MMPSDQWPNDLHGGVHHTMIKVSSHKLKKKKNEKKHNKLMELITWICRIDMFLCSLKCRKDIMSLFFSIFTRLCTLLLNFKLDIKLGTSVMADEHF